MLVYLAQNSVLSSEFSEPPSYGGNFLSDDHGHIRLTANLQLICGQLKSLEFPPYPAKITCIKSDFSHSVF